ncbi:S-adenosyl-L-methionine-dependent methyltransferase [Aaosphaeria arxii CBS 175.79]|uniref:S-adenosyl-L-methionine-dependent methyltransferase n=1 Tax=Aaosphaeria arxii CBS 175.79 TaxID=1450172 RepID=A0A6A5XFF6_9PLEO|nr:S-adenosyl-L-methionine-dependent methyltransferase [Aaosphaeria arxii CBS 175.79]KAF2011557.1 S-adenosyl-L-methionine-dependent methyltransferase [Aaosphaeria arxii CBS 175.79]
MTQPTSVNMTFDTSLVDVSQLDPQTPILNQGEISQTTPKPSQATITGQAFQSSTPVQHIPTQEAYDQWAHVYDTDGNMLQSIDDSELNDLLPSLLGRVCSSHDNTNMALNLLDLGCGTGRNTSKLLSYSWPSSRNNARINIIGLDFSKGMLDVAAHKLTSMTRDAEKVILRLEEADCFPTVHNPSTSPKPNVANLPPIDGLISTLVLEHIPLRDFFATLAALVTKGGFALVTNMHNEMGNMSQAGFVNAEGVKVRGDSYVYSVEETIDEARRAGFEVVNVKERSVEENDMRNGVVGERGWKWVGIRVWYGVILKKTA